METRYYNLETLVSELEGYEQRFGLSTDELVRLYRCREVPSQVPAHDAFVWADLQSEVERLAALNGGATPVALLPAG